MSLLVVSDRRTESSLLSARLRMRGLPVNGDDPRVVLVAKSELEPIEVEIIGRVRQRGGVVLQLERAGDAPIAEALSVAVPAGLDDVAGLVELAWLQALHATRVWKVDLERMPPQRLLKSLKAARDAFVIEARLFDRVVRIEIERGEVKSARYGTLKDALALRAFEQHKSGTVQIRLSDAAIKAEALRDADAGLPVSFFAPPKVVVETPAVPAPIEAPAVVATPASAPPVIAPSQQPIQAQQPLPPATPVPDVVVREELVDMLPKYPAAAVSAADELVEEDPFASQQRTRRLALLVAAALGFVALAFAGRALVTSDAPPAPVVTKVEAPAPAPVVEEEPLELPPLSAERVLHLESTLATARGLFAQNKAAEGVQLFETAVAAGPTKPQYVLALARLYLDAGQLAQAMSTAEKLTKVYPGFAEGYLIQGTVLQLQNAEWTRTKALYERYLELQPNGLHAKDVRGILSRH